MEMIKAILIEQNEKIIFLIDMHFKKEEHWMRKKNSKND